MLDPAEITFNMIFRLNVIVFLLHSRMSMKCSMNFNLNPFLTNTVWKVSVFRVFLVRISAHSDWIRRGTPYLCSIFSPNVGEYGPEKLRIRTIFPQCNVLILYHLKTPKQIVFLVFSGGIKWKQWPEMV